MDLLQDLLRVSNLSEEVFLSRYTRIRGTPGARHFYVSTMRAIQAAILECNFSDFEKLANIVCFWKESEESPAMKTFYECEGDPFRHANPIIVACSCKCPKVEAVEYVLVHHDVFNKLSLGGRRDGMRPGDKDSAHHNAFYYAIRSGQVQLLELLIDKWPENFFQLRPDILDDILSNAYDELTLRRVPLSEEVKAFVEGKLLELRFFRNVSEGPAAPGVLPQQNDQECRNRTDSKVSEIAGLMLDKIDFLVEMYCTSGEVDFDETFIYTAKCIACHMHILKRHLKGTYCLLPWEEIEFCLAMFISSRTKKQELNILYHAQLKKTDLLRHLQNFSETFRETDILRYLHGSLPKIRRDAAVHQIIRKKPHFRTLYNDFQVTRDVYSLEIINDYINLALLARSTEHTDRLVVVRALQVIGEHLKNTLESPKLSSSVGEMLLQTLTNGTRKTLTGIRDALSHAHPIIHHEGDSSFFFMIQNDVKKMGHIISDFFFQKKLDILRMHLGKILKCDNIEQVTETVKVLDHIGLGAKVRDSFEMLELAQLEELATNLSECVREKTSYEEEMFNQISDTIGAVKTKLDTTKTRYTKGLSMLKLLNCLTTNFRLNECNVKHLKEVAGSILDEISPEEVTKQRTKPGLRNIPACVEQILKSALFRLKPGETDFAKICARILSIVNAGLGNVDAIKEFGNNLNYKQDLGTVFENICIPEGKRAEVLKKKQQELKHILEEYEKDILIYSTDAHNKKLQAGMEMLLVEIFSILSPMDVLFGNDQYVFDNYPLLAGKILRNHLAHFNIVNDLLLSDLKRMVYFNAEKLVSADILNRSKKTGKSEIFNLEKFRKADEARLCAISNQKDMFSALESGDFGALKLCISKGADIYAQDRRGWSSLHFASKGNSMDIVSFLLGENVGFGEDAEGRNPLHIAALHNSKNVADYLVKVVGVRVDEVDQSGKTSLHLAAQHGHRNVVATLLANHADALAGDVFSVTPLEYAARNGHRGVTQALLANGKVSGLGNLLVQVAGLGHADIIHLLVQNGAKVGAKGDKGHTALHAAALNGHLDILQALISENAEVNAVSVDGETPLHAAALGGHEDIAELLLKQGADPSALAGSFTPLHYAAMSGHEKIVQLLLKNQACLPPSPPQCSTPLHMAALNGHFQAVLALVTNGADVNARAEKDSTPLHNAAKSGNLETVQLLVQKKAAVNRADVFGMMPLHYAVSKSHAGIVAYLIANNACVNTKAMGGVTTLHVAATKDNTEVVDILLRNKADFDIVDALENTAMHSAARSGKKGVVGCLIKNGVPINVHNASWETPLHVAAKEGHTDVVDILLENKAFADNRSNSGSTPLLDAIKRGHKSAAELLINNGASVTLGDGSDDSKDTPLEAAVRANEKDLVQLLVSKGAIRSLDTYDGLLSSAILGGNEAIVEIFLKQKYFAKIQAKKTGYQRFAQTAETVMEFKMQNKPFSMLHIAAFSGQTKIAALLIDYKVNVNSTFIDGSTPLHYAASAGFNDIVTNLLNNGVNINARDHKNRTAIDLAVAYGRLDVVKTLVEFKADVNAKSGDLSLLHIAAQEQHLDVIKYLVTKGADIHARNDSDSKPVHFAARDGTREIVEFFIQHGASLHDRGLLNQTLLHYATMNPNLDCLRYLIEQGMDVNGTDDNGKTPLHSAALSEQEDAAAFLLTKGAVYNIRDKLSRTPSSIGRNRNIIDLLSLTKQLFDAVRRNDPLETERCVEKKASANAKSVDESTPLHIGAWKGFGTVVDILLNSGCDPNALNRQGGTALHYAAKFSHLDVVKSLLSRGAIYNKPTHCGKTPLHLSSDEDVKVLLETVDKCFESIESPDSCILDILYKMQDTDTVRAIMNAQNREGKSIIVLATVRNHPYVEELKSVRQPNVFSSIKEGFLFLRSGRLKEALTIFQRVHKERLEVLASDNPGSLDAQEYCARTLFELGDYLPALESFSEIFEKRKESFGCHDIDALRARSKMAAILLEQGENEKSLYIYQDTYSKLKDILGSRHDDVLTAQTSMALALGRMKRYEEALHNLHEAFTRRMKSKHPDVLHILNIKASFLAEQFKFGQALEVYKETVRLGKEVLNMNHTAVFQAVEGIANVYLEQERLCEAMKTFKALLKLQADVLGKCHPKTEETRCKMRDIRFLF